MLERSHLILQSNIYFGSLQFKRKQDPDVANLQDFTPSEMVVERGKRRKCVGVKRL